MIKIITFFASQTVPTPTVKAVVGTLETSPPKNLEFTMIVSFVKVASRVREVKEEPGSLKAMCPSTPTPPRNKSIPPAASIAFSYSAHSFSLSAARPSRI